MKTALIIFGKKEYGFDSAFSGKVTDIFALGGIDIDTFVFLCSDDLVGFRRKFIEFKDTVDNLIIVAGEEVEFDYKEVIAELMDSALAVNDNARLIIEEMSGIDENMLDSYSQLPLEATLVPNKIGLIQGFMMEDNDFSVIVLPSKIEELSYTSENYVLIYLDEKYHKNVTRLTMKYFGDTEKLRATLEEIKRDLDDIFSYKLKTVCGDTSLSLIFTTIDKAVTGGAVRQIIEKHKENIYAEFDTTLEERIFDLLKLRGVKISVAESFTGGRIASALIKNSGISKYMHEGIVSYSNESKMQRLKVKEQDINTVGAVSSKVAYQMCAGLLIENECDIAISTTGIAGPKSDNTYKPVGLCYIGVGMKNGVHTYRYNFTGDREEITETAKNTALFLAIKKLKNI